ncbi:MAG: hypothetical protein AAGB12_02730 [Pseudomonadota bacterium]
MNYEKMIKEHDFLVKKDMDALKQYTVKLMDTTRWFVKEAIADTPLFAVAVTSFVCSLLYAASI